MATNWQCQNCSEIVYSADPGCCMNCGENDDWEIGPEPQDDEDLED